LSDPRIQEQTRAWVDKFRPLLEMALDDFLVSVEWPERERFRRQLVQRGLDELSLDELLLEMPGSHWESRQFPPDRIVLSLQVLQELDKTQPLLDACVGIIQKAYALYRSHEHDPVISSNDFSLAAAFGPYWLLRAREVLSQHPPSPLGGGTAGKDTTEWTRSLNDAAISAFKDVASIDDYLAAQERLISQDPYRRARPLPSLPYQAGRTVVLGEHSRGSETVSGPAELFVVMPFSETWSAGTYAFIRRAVKWLEAPEGALHLYRADEIAEPGQISQQIKDSIAAAHVVIADITDVNPNVMWELGYADGIGKTIVILNQSPTSSPFDMVDRRQVAYSISPTDEEEENLLRHIIEALRSGYGRGFTPRSS
jgi:hypothetical protein